MKHFFILLCAIPSLLIAQNPEIDVKLPNFIPPSPSVAGLMKFEEVPVNNYTGIPDITLPVFSSKTKAKDLNINISLKYHPGSVTPNEHAGQVGLGWSLFDGGSISRTVRGIPDETIIALAGQEKMGLYYNSTGPNPYNYYNIIPLLSNNQTLLSLAPNDLSLVNRMFWNAQVRGIADTEHDLWQFNFLGKSGRFYIKKNSNNQLEIVPLDDYRVKIVNIYGDSNNSYIPMSFKIYDEQGYIYTFDVVENTNVHNLVESVSSTTYQSFLSTSPSYTYKSSFQLTKIEDYNGNTLVTFSYNSFQMNESYSNATYTTYELDYQKNEANNIMPVRDFYLDNPCESNVRNFQPYPSYSNSMNIQTIATKKVTNISLEGYAKIDYSYTSGRQDGNYLNAADVYLLNNISVKNWNNELISDIAFDYEYINTKQNRLFLKSVEYKNAQNQKKEKIFLEYKRVNNPYGSPDYVGTDYWGNFNLKPYPPMDGVNREVDPIFCTSELLQKMKLPTGGCVIYNFEPNTYSYIGNTPVTDFNANIHNWNNFENHVNFLPLSSSQSVPLDSTVNSTSFFTIVDEQEVYFKANIVSASQNNLFDYFFQIRRDNCNVGCAGETIYFTENENEKIVKVFLLPGSYSVSFYSPNLGSHPNLVRGEIGVYYRTKKNTISKYLYGGGNRIGKIGYFDEEVDKNYYTNNDTSPLPKREKKYSYTDDNNYSTGSLVFAVPNFSYETKKRECPNCQGTPIYSPNSVNQTATYQADNLYWWYKVYTTFNNLSVIKTQGSDVGYKTVKVYETDNGYSIFNYTSPIEHPVVYDELNLRPPFLPVVNEDYKCGLLISEKHYNNFNQLLSETINDYEIDENILVTGFKTYYKGTDFINIFNYKDFSYYENYLKYCSQSNTYTYNSHPFTPNNGSAGFCYFGSPIEFIGYKLIKEKYGWVKLLSKETKSYFYDAANNQSEVKTREYFTYNPLNKMIAEHKVINSPMDETKSIYTYVTLSNVLAQNRIGEIEQIQTIKDGALLNNSKIVYSNTLPGNTSYVPAIIQTAKGTNPFENKIRYNRYDAYGNPLEVQQENGMLIAYIWGYNNTQVVAKIENISYSAIPSNLITAIQNATNSNSSEAVVLGALESLRNHSALANSMVTTVTYIPLVGQSTITDPKGMRMRFYYDSMNRLQKVADSEGNIISENQYNYRP